MNEITKKCFKCNAEKPLSMYYKHRQMADGHLNKCKECTKKDTVNNRNNRIEYYREYDRGRGNRQGYGYVKHYRGKYPRKHAAHKAVYNAIKSGVLIPQNCEICNSSENIHAHHDDYARQLDVTWLCCACHKQWHVKNGEGLNGI